MGELKKDETRPGTMMMVSSTVGGLIVTILLSCLAWQALGRPIEELPGWIEAGATVAAVGAAILAGSYAARAYRLEHQREQRWENERRSEQASQVVAWPLGPTTVSQGGQTFLRGVAATIRNISTLPVNDVQVTFFMEVDYGRTLVEVARWETDFLPPEHKQVVNATPVDVGSDRVRVPGGGAPRILLELTFRDLANVEWLRSLDGRLRELEGPHW